MNICLYSSVDSKELFERVGFYRDDVHALSLRKDNVLATNSLWDLLRFRPRLVVGYFFSKSILAALLGRVVGARVILTGGADQISPVLSSGLKLFVRRVMAFLGLCLSHRILLSCTDDVANFKKLCFRIRTLEEKLELVNHVVLASPDREYCQAARSRSFHAITLCWMGAEANVRRKGVDKAIRLVAQLLNIGVDARLDIAGTDGPGRVYLERLAEELKVSDRIKYLGAISEEEKYSLFRRRPVYLQLSSHEGFGVAAAEAFFSGMIVVHSNMGGLRDVIAERGIIFPLTLETQDEVAYISDFYKKYLSFEADLDFLKSNIGNYSLKMRSDAFFK